MLVTDCESQQKCARNRGVVNFHLVQCQTFSSKTFKQHTHNKGQRCTVNALVKLGGRIMFNTVNQGQSVTNNYAGSDWFVHQVFNGSLQQNLVKNNNKITVTIHPFSHP